MSKILVTGGTGFIGFHLVKQLVEQGHAVTVLDRLYPGELDAEVRGYLTSIRYVQTDWSAPLSDRMVGGKFDHVFHMVSVEEQVGMGMTDFVLRTNLLSTIHLLNWCVKHPPQTFLYASTSEAYVGFGKQGQTPFAEPMPVGLLDVQAQQSASVGSKLAGELLTLHHAKQNGFQARVARYFNVYGPRMPKDHLLVNWLQRMAARENPFVLPGAKQSRALCYVTDAVEATVKLGLMDSGESHVVNVGNAAEEVKMRELCERLFAIAKYHALIQELPANAGTPERSCPDLTLIKKLIDYTPRISLQEGLERIYVWAMSNRL